MNVERWDTCEFAFQSGAEYDNPFTDVEFTVGPHADAHVLVGGLRGWLRDVGK